MKTRGRKSLSNVLRRAAACVELSSKLCVRLLQMPHALEHAAHTRLNLPVQTVALLHLSFQVGHLVKQKLALNVPVRLLLFRLVQLGTVQRRLGLAFLDLALQPLVDLHHHLLGVGVGGGGAHNPLCAAAEQLVVVLADAAVLIHGCPRHRHRLPDPARVRVAPPVALESEHLLQRGAPCLHRRQLGLHVHDGAIAFLQGRESQVRSPRSWCRTTWAKLHL
mmetsp:Transcript_28499/g.54374  ORF Transcript_28499/g.54374 Transcript_28499/m.54374 type:complete len:221 (+) Transcript_28499:503-1165(+)